MGRRTADQGKRIGRRRVLVSTAALGGAALLASAAGADAATPRPRPSTAQGRETVIDGPAGRLAVWEKWPAGTARGVALLVHGATYPGQMVFDFSFPGDYSLMDYLVERGLGTVTFSIRGYGRSDAPADGFSVNTEAGVADLSAVADWLATRGYARPYLLGWSWGGLISVHYVARHSERVERLVVYAPAMGAALGGSGAPPPSEGYQVNSVEQVLGRIEPALTDPEARQEFAEQAVRSSPRTPNGSRAEDRAIRNPDPSQIVRPTLMIYGAVDQLYHSEWVGTFFAGIATDDKALVVVPRAGHFLIMQRPRQRLYEAAERFFSASPVS
jgi:alpha-beta hydrolase superfamily lysophospholipase